MDKRIYVVRRLAARARAPHAQSTRNTPSSTARQNERLSTTHKKRIHPPGDPDYQVPQPAIFQAFSRHFPLPRKNNTITPTSSSPPPPATSTSPPCFAARHDWPLDCNSPTCQLPISCQSTASQLLINFQQAATRQQLRKSATQR